MRPSVLKEKLRFYFITDERADLPLADQVRAALAGGATMIQYRHKNFSPAGYEALQEIRTMCRVNETPFIVNDDIILARAVDADGVHLGQDDESAEAARRILGADAVVGRSVSTPAELEKTDTRYCDYIGTGPVFGTASKKDPKPVIGVEGLRAVIARADRPVVAIGGIDDSRAAACLEAGACGVAVISCISRAEDPVDSARRLAAACGLEDIPDSLGVSWQDEFALIDRLLSEAPRTAGTRPVLEIFPGDDAAVLTGCRRPVVSSDAHLEGVHFSLDWQSPEAVGYKAAVTVLSDLAASYARPVAMFVNLTLPKDFSEAPARALYGGLNRALRDYECALGGGNLAAGARLGLNMFVVGDNTRNFYPARGNARPGQLLCATGRLGLSRAGLWLLQNNQDGPAELLEAFRSPRARFDAAEVLADNKVDCVIDISDGLAGDAAHIARASQVTVAVDLDPALLGPPLADFCTRFGESPEKMVLQGGEDYELLFCCWPKQFESIRKSLPDLFRVGSCEAFSGRYLENVPSNLQSFRHA